MNGTTTNRGHLMAQKLRQRFWSRVCSRKDIGAGDLIRVHRHAQQSGIPTDEAVVALGVLTEDQVLEILTDEDARRASA